MSKLHGMACHGSMAKNPPANPGDGDSTPGSERSPGEENGKPLQYFCLGNSTDRRPWSAKVRGVTKETDTAGGNRQTRLRLDSRTPSPAGLWTLSYMTSIYGNDIPTRKPSLEGRAPGLVSRLSVVRSRQDMPRQ